MIAPEDRHGFVTGGTWCADHNKLVERWPAEEDLVIIHEEEIRGGGSACNLAIDIRRLDPAMPVATIGLVGDDADGRILVRQAEAEGLDCAGFAMLAGQRTTFTDAFTARDTGRRTHLYHPGTSGALTPDHFDLSASDARILHLGLPGLHEQMDSKWMGDANGWVTVLKAAQAAGLRTNFELCSLPAERLARIMSPCLAHLDYLIVNEFEIAAIAGRPVSHGQDTDIGSCIVNAQLVLDDGAMELVIVHFPMGAVAVTRRGDRLVSPSVNVPPDRIAGSNGAGDAFAAGALYGLHQGWALDRIVELAHAAAAASMGHIGTTDAMAGWSDCLALASGHGWREAPE
jgi:sugar/nucleoside kinase (ribokinase family)